MGCLSQHAVANQKQGTFPQPSRSQSENGYTSTSKQTQRIFASVKYLHCDYSNFIPTCWSARGGIAARALATHRGEPGSFSDFLMLVSCRTMPLVGGFSRGSSGSGAAPYSPHFTLSGSQDLDVKSRPNLSTPFPAIISCLYTCKMFRVELPVSLLASHQGGPGSVPCWVTPRFSHVGIVSDDAVGQQIFLGEFPFPPPLSFRHLLTSITLIGSQDLAVKQQFRCCELGCCVCACVLEAACGGADNARVTAGPRGRVAPQGGSPLYPHPLEPQKLQGRPTQCEPRRIRVAFRRYSPLDQYPAIVFARSSRCRAHEYADATSESTRLQNGLPPMGTRARANHSFQDKLDVQHVYTEVSFAIGLQFVRHALDDSEPIADLQGNKCHTAGSPEYKDAKGNGRTPRKPPSTSGIVRHDSRERNPGAITRLGNGGAAASSVKEDLRCLRNTIHTNLMATYVLADFLWIFHITLQVRLRPRRGEDVHVVERIFLRAADDSPALFPPHHLLLDVRRSSFQDKLDVQHVYSEVSFVIGSQFIRHALDNSEPIADVKETSSGLLDSTKVNWIRFSGRAASPPPPGFFVSPPTPPFHSGAAPYSPHFTLIGSQDLDVKSRPHIFPLTTNFCSGKCPRNTMRDQGQEARERYGRQLHARLAPHRSYAQGVQCFRHYSPLTEIRFDSGRGRSPDFRVWNRPGRCRWSAWFLGGLPFPPALVFQRCSIPPRFVLIASHDLHHQLGSPLVDNRPIMNAVKFTIVSGVLCTNRTMASSNTDTNRTGVLTVVDIAVRILLEFSHQNLCRIAWAPDTVSVQCRFSVEQTPCPVSCAEGHGDDHPWLLQKLKKCDTLPTYAARSLPFVNPRARGRKRASLHCTFLALRPRHERSTWPRGRACNWRFSGVYSAVHCPTGARKRPVECWLLLRLPATRRRANGLGGSGWRQKETATHIANCSRTGQQNGVADQHHVITRFANQRLGWEKREIPEKTRRPAASSGTIPTCENPGVTRPGIEPGSHWLEASRLTTQPI
ncbi:hypothetical protein PR048_033469 [Dryococelus australis]|uniref:Uncharacterized protein n=1 Tax=Dryococelus australis TaxID=614101 RepID=A0ABQ9G374_9NEOP|nr:hypothetical protein PR048_033469 [Dryococelus australis]